MPNETMYQCPEIGSCYMFESVESCETHHKPHLKTKDCKGNLAKCCPACQPVPSASTEPQTATQELSKCCNAFVILRLSVSEGPRWYQCSKCGNPCEVVYSQEGKPVERIKLNPKEIVSKAISEEVARWANTYDLELQEAKEQVTPLSPELQCRNYNKAIVEGCEDEANRQLDLRVKHLQEELIILRARVSLQGKEIESLEKEQ